MRGKFLFLPPFLLACAVYLSNLSRPGLFYDGYLYAAMGRNMLLRNNFLIPHLNEFVYNKFFHHTPLFFILEAFFFKIFGASYASSRAFVSLFSLSSVVLVFFFLSSKSSFWGLLASLALALMPPLMKKTSFPNIDPLLMLSTFLSSVFFLWGIQSPHWRYWILGGLFFGGSLLLKGPLAFFFPLSVLIFLFLKKKEGKRWIFSPQIFTLFSLGVLLFSIWPMALFFNGEFGLFQKYLNFTFVKTAWEGRGQAPTSFLTYFKFLILHTNLFFFLFLYGSFKSFQGNEDTPKFFTIHAWTVLLLLSLSSFKYSHYLMQIYPSMAIVLSYPWYKKLSRYRSFLSLPPLALALILAVFLNLSSDRSKGSRDRPIFEARKRFNEKGISPKKWLIYKDSYPFWNLNNLNAWEDRSFTEKIHHFSPLPPGTVLLVKNQYKNEIPKSLKSFQVENYTFFFP